MNSWSKEKADLTCRVLESLNEVKEIAAGSLVPDYLRVNFVNAVSEGASFLGVLLKSRDYHWDLPISFLSSAQKWCLLVEKDIKSLEQSISSTT